MYDPREQIWKKMEFRGGAGDFLDKPVVENNWISRWTLCHLRFFFAIWRGKEEAIYLFWNNGIIIDEEKFFQ